MIFKFGRSDRGPHTDPVVRKFVQQHMPSPESFLAKIAEEDEMFLFGLKTDQEARRRNAIGYYLIGSRIFGAIKQIGDWHFSKLENVGAFLDFACGYGRSTRFLAEALPRERIWASDIYRKAVAFQKRNLGVHGIVSVPDPRDYPKQNRFDYIFASSFFTHMPESTFTRWMETLYGLLTERGILVFSTHDASLLPPSLEMPPAGILFLEASESRTLAKSQYGSTYVNQKFVTQVVDTVTGGKAHLHRIERGLDRFQDIYVLAKHLNRDFSGLSFFHDPGGYFDWGEISADGTVSLNGWAADINAGGAIKEVQVASNGKVVAAAVPSHNRQDIAAFFQRPDMLQSGWTVHVKRDVVHLDDFIEIWAVNNRGQSRIIAFDRLESMARAAGRPAESCD